MEQGVGRGVSTGWSLAAQVGNFLAPNLAIVKGYTEAMACEPSGRYMATAAA
jgi:hypothetical protein